MSWTEDKSWRPIESAPRDGTHVQLLIPYNRKKFSEAECTDEGYWDSEVIHYGWKENDPPPRKLKPLRKGCFRFDGDDGAFDIQPTHWRPLFTHR